MSAFLPAENLSDTMTVAQLVEKLSDLNQDSLVIIRFTRTEIVEGEAQSGDHTIHGPSGSVTIRQSNPLDCAIESEDIEPKDGVVYLCTGHEALDGLLQ